MQDFVGLCWGEMGECVVEVCYWAGLLGLGGVQEAGGVGLGVFAGCVVYVEGVGGE